MDEWADLCHGEARRLLPRRAGFRWKAPAASRCPRSSSSATKYSESMGATFMDEDGEEKPFIMGCYGVGISRTVAAIVEQHNDEHGIMLARCRWRPPTCAWCRSRWAMPRCSLWPRRSPTNLAELGFEVVIDDRDERAGVKFADADLIGWPVQIVVGKRGLKEGKVEMKLRRTGEKKEVALDALAEMMGFARRAMRDNVLHGAGTGAFAAIFG